MSRAEFDQEIEHGSLYAGAPETVAKKIVATVRALDIARFGLKYSAGTLSHDRLMRASSSTDAKSFPECANCSADVSWRRVHASVRRIFTSTRRRKNVFSHPRC
jgi:hypothetical protein